MASTYGVMIKEEYVALLRVDNINKTFVTTSALLIEVTV